MIGQTLSQFEITAKLGEGGMGAVYRARDTKLGREVAIKVLPEDFTADAERLARFEREAKVLASLSHPNIAGIFQVEEADGQQLLVMELVEGYDLAERLERGPVGVEEASGIVLQAAEGLEAAHERGVVHRDLKPANIKVTSDGQVKVLDFGLAKAHEASQEASPDMTRSPTLTAQMTQAGVILGTAAYMSPEQARGQEADPRSDLWALGVILWEMLTGRRLFAEATISDTLAAVLRAEIDFEAFPPETPRRLRKIVERCLAREPKQRYHSAADLRLDLADSLARGTDVPPAEAATVPAARLPWILAATAAVLAAVFASMAFWRSTSEESKVSAARIATSIVSSPGVEFAPLADGLALSPDGTQLAFIGVDANGQRSIWIRSMARAEVSQIAKTEGADVPFWSPDGSWLAFIQEGELKTVQVETGLIEVLAPSTTEGGSWGRNGDILFTGSNRRIMAVRWTGGTPRNVTEEPDGTNDYFRPSFLPDGRHFLFHERRYSSDEQIGLIRVGSLDGSPSKPLLEAYSTAHYVEPGFLLWWHQGNLRAQRFDPERLEFLGDPFSVVSDILWDPRSAIAGYTASNNGILIYRAGGRIAGNQLTWIGRDGELLGAVGPTGSLYSQRLSPDGSQIAVDISGDSNQGDIWIIDSESGLSSPVVTWPEDESYPVWSPTGRELAIFSSRGGGNARIFRVDLQSGGDPEVFYSEDDVNVVPKSWLPDGRTLIFLRGTYEERDIMSLDLDSGEVREIVADDSDTRNPSLSADGQWVAFDSDTTGRTEVYISPFPEASRRIRVSMEGGFAPLWSPDGSEIFFASLSHDAIFSVQVQYKGGELELSRPAKLFSVDMKEHRNRQFDTSDGQRFLVNFNLGGGVHAPLTVLQNWASGL